MKTSLDEIAQKIGKQVDFKYVFRNEEELLSLSFNVYRSPRAFYISKEGISYAFDSSLLVSDPDKVLK